MDTLFSHVSIVTMDDRMSVWTDSFLGVTDGKISYLGKKAPEEQPQTIIDGSGMVPDVGRAGVPAAHERMVPTAVYQHGRHVYRKSFVPIRSIHEKTILFELSADSRPRCSYVN